MNPEKTSDAGLANVQQNSTSTMNRSSASARSMFTVDYILSGRSHRDSKARKIALESGRVESPGAMVDRPFLTGNGTDSSSSSGHLKRKVQKVYPLRTVLPPDDYDTHARESWHESTDKFSRSRPSSSCSPDDSDIHVAPYGKAFDPTAPDAYCRSPDRSSRSPTSSSFYDSGVSETASPPRDDAPKCQGNSSYDAVNSSSRDPSGMDYLVVDALTDDEASKADSDSGLEDNKKKKKKKKRRVLFTKLQTRELERRFYSSYYISPQERDALAKELNMDPDQVKIWFQNHRYKLKKYHKENGDRGLAMPYYRGGPYPVLLRDARRPDFMKDGLFYDFAKDHPLGNYIKDPRIFEGAKSLNPALFTTPCHPKQVMAVNRIIPSYSAPMLPLSHPYPYDLTYANYYLNPSSSLLGPSPLSSGPMHQSGSSPQTQFPGPGVIPHAFYSNPLHMVFSKPVM